MKRGRPRHRDTLTPRELEVLGLVREGLTNEQIAERLGVSANTVKFHVSEIFGKLGVRSRQDASAWLAKRGAGGLLGAFAHASPKGWLLRAAVGSAALTGVAALVFLFVAALDNRPNHPAAGPLGKIAYVKDGDVWVKALPAGKAVRVTRGGNNMSPRWSASGEWLSYTVMIRPATGAGPPQWETWLVNSDSGKRRRVDVSVTAGAWLPHSETLMVFDGDRMFVEDADGGARHEVLRPYSSAAEEGRIGGLTVSANGEWFAYLDERWPAGSTRPKSAAEGWSYAGIWVEKLDGSGARELISLGVSPKPNIVLMGWTGDSRNVLFFVDPEDSLPFDGLPLRAVAIDGGPIHELGVTVLPFQWETGMSPIDGRLAIAAGGQQETWTNKRIGILDVTQDRFTVLTDPEVAAVAPAWSPDGSLIAYASSPDTGPEGRDSSLPARRIWVMAPDGSQKRQLTPDEAYRDDRPQWSADGRHILFARLSPEPCDHSSYSLWLLSLEDGSIEEVATGLPSFVTRNARPKIGEVPKCESEGEGAITDWFGSIDLRPVLDWWRPGCRILVAS